MERAHQYCATNQIGKQRQRQSSKLAEPILHLWVENVMKLLPLLKCLTLSTAETSHEEKRKACENTDGANQVPRFPPTISEVGCYFEL